MTPHERDRYFLAWLRRATPHQLAAASMKAKHRWQAVAIARAAAKVRLQSLPLPELPSAVNTADGAKRSRD